MRCFSNRLTNVELPTKELGLLRIMQRVTRIDCSYSFLFCDASILYSVMSFFCKP